MHRLALQYHFLYALYHLDGNEFIGKHKSEEHAFLFEELLLVLDSLLTLFRCPLALQLLLPLCCQLVVEGFEVGRADVLQLTYVLGEVAQEVYRVAPKRAVGNGVAVADADSHGCPIVLHVAGGVEVVAQHGVLPCLYQRFRTAVGQECRDEFRGYDVVEVTSEAVPAQLVHHLVFGAEGHVGNMLVGKVVATDCHG